jgi:hypothetical protein
VLKDPVLWPDLQQARPKKHLKKVWPFLKNREVKVSIFDIQVTTTARILNLALGSKVMKMSPALFFNTIQLKEHLKMTQFRIETSCAN